jgi:hypothetical protein
MVLRTEYVHATEPTKYGTRRREVDQLKAPPELSEPPIGKIELDRIESRAGCSGR